MHAVPGQGAEGAIRPRVSLKGVRDRCGRSQWALLGRASSSRVCAKSVVFTERSGRRRIPPPSRSQRLVRFSSYRRVAFSGCKLAGSRRACQIGTVAPPNQPRLHDETGVPRLRASARALQRTSRASGKGTRAELREEPKRRSTVALSAAWLQHADCRSATPAPVRRDRSRGSPPLRGRRSSRGERLRPPATPDAFTQAHRSSDIQDSVRVSLDFAGPAREVPAVTCHRTGRLVGRRRRSSSRRPACATRAPSGPREPLTPAAVRGWRRSERPASHQPLPTQSGEIP